MEMDSIIGKYFLLQELDPTNGLLEFFSITKEGGFKTNLNAENRDEFIERFGQKAPSAEDFFKDRQKVPLSGRVYEITHFLFTNYETALEQEIERLKDDRLESWEDKEKREKEDKMIEFYWGFKED